MANHFTGSGRLPAFAATPTFNADIAPILYRNCATCHRPGEVAPFSLLSYEDAAKRAKTIAAATARRYMPPWHAEPGFGHFANERRLTDTEIAAIAEWASAGAPEGDPAHKSTPPVFADGWQAGKPDLVVTSKAKFELPASGPDQFLCIVIPMGLERDAFAKTFEFRPENRKIVHHALIFTDATGAASKLAGPDGTYPCFGGPRFQPVGLVGGWAPGSTPNVQPEGMSVPLRKGSNLVLQLHYHPSGKPETDQSSLGITFGDAPTVGRGLMLLSNFGLNIPPGEKQYVAKSSLTVPTDVEVFGIAPHAHYLGKEMKIVAHTPDGIETPLIWIKDWDFNWQGNYRYVDPIKLPKGTRIDMEYSFDNSADNPRNPTRPPVQVQFGEQTQDEMALAFIGVKLPTIGAERTFQQAMNLQTIEQLIADPPRKFPENIPPQTATQLRMGIALFDKNGDGKLDETERKPLMDLIRGRN